jgi:non-specific serine/threonine protein kinase/serine/threonine-protein kinase
LQDPGDPISEIESRITGHRPSTPPGPDLRDTQIGPYKLLQRLGEGGMGTVWVAEQTEPVRRRLALKVIKPGMDSQEVLRRFEAERQALALMDHTNIAKVFDAGTTQSGLPYFVMELVKGLPITKYCDELRVPIRERLKLFVPVCQAIQHAHQKGIIHRDIKPANVMVSVQDGDAVPKVIDFGVAKALHQRLTERTMYTAVGALIGTLEYMSPEQAELSALDVDTRADVYALGVLLYELLTGTTPLAARLRDLPLSERLRVIREDEPPRPSTRLTHSGDKEAALAALRGTDPARLRRDIRGDLDWIVMKALEKDRTRRYETANGLARDVERYLAHEAVEASPPSTFYRMRKTLRRYRTAALAGAACLLLLVAGAAISTWQAIRATNAEREAAAINDFLLRDLLGQADLANQEAGAQGRDPEVTVRTLLDRAGQNIAGKFAKDPLTEAALRATIGKTYQGLGRYAEARPHLERAVELFTARTGPGHPDTLRSKNDLAWLYWYDGKYDAAGKLFVEVADRRAERLGRRHLETLDSRHGLAVVYWSQRKFEAADALFEEVVRARTEQLGADHRDTLTAKNNRAVLYRSQRKYDKAEPLFAELVASRVARLGPDHPDTLNAKNNLATVYRDQGKYDRAEPLLDEVIRARTLKLGPDHPATLRSQSSLAVLYRERKEYDRAEALFRTTLEGRTKKLGPDHPDTLRSLANIALVNRDRGRLAAAEPLFRSAAEGSRRALGLSHPDTQQRIRDLIACLEQMGQPARAEPFSRELVELWREQGGVESPRYLDEVDLLAANLLAQKKPEEAEPVLRGVLAIRQKREPAAWTTLHTQALLGAALLGQRRSAEADPLLRRAYDGLLERAVQLPADGRARVGQTAARLAQLYAANGREDDAARWRRAFAPGGGSAGASTR